MENATQISHTIPYWYTYKEGVLGEIQVSGLLKIENEKFILEYQTDSDAFNKLMIYLNRKLKGSFQPTPIESGAIQHANFSFSNLEKVEISTSIWQSTALLYIQAKDLNSFQEIPGRKAGTLELIIRKKDAQAIKKRIPKSLLRSV